MQPEYIFETSWEVCNRVGGIYAVLSTRACSMQQEHKDRVVFFGPDLGEQSNLYFQESASVLKGWRPQGVRVGRWLVPGKPIAVLLPWTQLEAQKNDIYAHVWQQYGVQSHAAYGDYDTSCLFAWAVGQVAENLYHFLHEPVTLMHCNEWQTAFTICYLKDHCPSIATLFTTHATSMGRSIAGNGKPLYDYLPGYFGDQMAQELNMVSKHSVEKTAAHLCDCFTTVSDITARECTQLLERTPDIVTPNGFEPDFVPTPTDFDAARTQARRSLIQYTRLRAHAVKNTSTFIGIAGRLEYKNKGIDVFLDAMRRLGETCSKPVTAFVMIPYLDQPDFTVGNVQVIFIPTYLNGNDGVINLPYYQLLIGLDLTAFPSYYEPWGYTPLESVAFHVPTITTSLSGFGVWAQGLGVQHLEQGVEVIPRTDSNYDDVVNAVVHAVKRYIALPSKQKAAARQAAALLAGKAQWKDFFAFYRQAYSIALTASQARA